MKNKKLLVLTIVLAVLLVAGSIFSIVRIKNDSDSIVTLNNKIVDLNESISDKTKQVEALASDVADKSSQIDTLTADLADKSSQIDALTANVADKSSQIDVLTADVADKSSQIDALTSDVADKSSQIDALTAEVADKFSQIDALTADVADKSSQIDALAADITAKATEIETLTTDLAAKTAEIETLTADVTKKSNRIEALETDVINKEAQIDSLNAALEEANREHGTDVVPKTVEPIVPVLSGDNWAITHEYSYFSRSDYTSSIVIHHTKTKDQTIDVSFSYYNSNNELIGVKSESIMTASGNVDYYISAVNDAPYNHVTYAVKLKDSDYMRSASSQLSISTSIVGKKVIITANNTGNEVLSLTQYHVLFLDQNGDLVATDWGFFDDIGPGESILVESKPYPNESFSDVKVYAIPYIHSW